MPDCFAVCDATWPAASTTRVGPWTIRYGKGGGSRVSAATLDGPMGDIHVAEQAMRALGQTPLFMIRNAEAALDNALEQAGYRIKDPVNIYAMRVADLLDRPPRVMTFTIWPPVQAQRDIWAAGGIGPARLAVMARAATPKTTQMGRLAETPAGTLFAGIHDGCAMVHAVEVAADFRGQGLGRELMRASARWALDNGATTMALLTTQANAAANGLYTSLGMPVVGQYHYRIQA